MSSLDSRNFEEGQVSQPVCLAANVTSGTDLSHRNSLSGNETKVSDVLPSSDPALPGASSNWLPISKSQNQIDGGVIQSEGSCRRFTLDEVLLATDNFDDALVIGIGGFGKVYRGFIDNGATTVAIKRLNAESNQGAEEFWTEVKLLSKFHHTNLVSLIGYCNENQEMILVYEYIARGTLADHLYKSSGEESSKSMSQYLTWAQRLNICLGAARGLNYLHTGAEQRIIHRDVKTTNILLDKNWVAKVSDFGICKLITSQATTHVSTKVKATRGYWDPEYLITGQVTRKSDVYAFGVVLLEVLCGRPPLDDKLEEEQISLIYWAKMYIEKGKLDRIMDPSINGKTTPHSLKYLAKLASNCLHTEPKKRPTMSEVVKSLEIAMVSHERKGRSQGTITKAIQGIKLVPMGMNRWWREGMGNSSNDRGGLPKQSFPELIFESQKSVYPRFSLDEIHAATNDFNEGLLISQHSSYRLYKGYALAGTPVIAIKRFESKQCLKEYSAEIQVHSLTRHPNIVSLIGVCEEKDELILVYNYLGNGTLKSHLHGSNNDSLLWKKRLEICIDTAQDLRGLDLQTGLFTYRQIKAATNDFDIDNKIGEGGFGSVYKGILLDGSVIAVKQLSSKSNQGNSEFVNEIGMISGLQHPNVVRLYGCCVERNQLLLVYEYMENNSLARALYGECQLNLDWPTRLRICIGIARGLVFLHEESRLKIVHRDIKATNVLLDGNLNPKISDFGLAKLSEDDNTHISTRVAGTIGYMAPEYALWGYLTDKADVYSFGVVALEIVTGRYTMEYRPNENYVCLLDWALVLRQQGCLMELVDPKLGSDFNKEEAMRMTKVALVCTNLSPALRPTMSAVVSMLEGKLRIEELVNDPLIYGDDFRFVSLRDKYDELQPKLIP
ncbi:hypothetical protein RHMOL_Rhmol02G0074200 [Rhododendron molle]|uniref:Uncharacterized protein n=1 Tax=Rhododendron molle TaxID=49168 RepID=A0ACC0PNW4_RHOML|nr:hypothetical protein RHMOL_Rhmol02G0074200 [Rhododendron molle]